MSGEGVRERADDVAQTANFGEGRAFCGKVERVHKRGRERGRQWATPQDVGGTSAGILRFTRPSLFSHPLRVPFVSDPTLVAALRRRIRAARRRLTLASATRGALVTAAAVGGAFLVALSVEAGVWMGVELRTAVFWLLTLSLAGLLAGLVVVPLLRGAGVLPGLDERAVVRRTGRDYAGVDDRLATFLDLADGRAALAASRLHDAALDALGREVQDVPFERVHAFGPVRKALPWALIPAALLVVLFVAAPNTMGAAAARLMAPGVYFAPPAPFQLQVEPGDAEVTRGADLPVRAVATGRDLPLSVTLEFGRADERATEEVRLQAADDGSFAYTVEGVRADLRYRVLADGVRTGWYKIEAVDRPLVRGLRVTVTPPGYSGRRSQTLPEGVGDVTGLAGSTVAVQVQFGGPEPVEGWLEIGWEDGRSQRVPLRIGSEAALGRFALRGAGAYSVHLRAANGLESTNPARYALGVLSDGPPQIALLDGADGSLTAGARRLTFRITDDFGFSGGSLVYRIAESPTRGASRPRRLRLPVRTRPLDQEVALDWRLPGAQPGDVVEFYGEVRDNDAARGGKTARTPLFTLRFPSLADRYDALDAQRDSTRESLDRLEEDAEESGERLERLRDDLRQSLDPDWEDKRQVDQLLQEQSDMQRQAQQLQQQMEQLSEQMQNSDLVDDDTRRMFEQMREVMQELDTPELRDALQRLRDAMERLDMRDMLQQSEEAARSEEEFRRRLERAMELMKRLEAAVEMEEVARRAEDLAETEERLARETDQLQDRQENGERRRDEQEAQQRQQDDQQQRDSGEREQRSPEQERQRLADEQRRAQEDAEAMEEQMRELQEQLEEIQNAPSEAVQQMMEQMQQEGDLSEKMDQNAEQIEQNELQEAKQGQQQMSEQLRQMAQQMRQQSTQMQGQQAQVDVAAIRRALEDVLTLSREQEALAGETERIPSENPALVPVARRQSEIRDGLRTVADTLRRVALTVPQLGADVDERAGNARREMEQAITQLAERQSGPSTGHQRMAMSHLNELALLLSELIDQMQNQAGSGSGQGMQQQMQQMGQQQQQLNQQIQQMLNETAGERLSPDQGRRLRQMAEQQEALRRGMQRMLEGGAGAGLNPNDQSALRRVEEQMREAARELRNGRLDERSAPRQQQILERMLQAERSMNQRGQEEQREAQTGQDRPPDRPATEPRTDRPADRVRRDLIRALESGYAPDYQDLIKRYFERLQARVAG